MASNVKLTTDDAHQPIRFSVEMPPETYSKIIRLIETSENTSNFGEVVAQAVQNWLESMMARLPEQAQERAEIGAIILEAEVDLRIVERVGDASLPQMPTRSELLAMPEVERNYWMQKAATLAEDIYLNDPELTITADATDIYDYPES